MRSLRLPALFVLFALTAASCLFAASTTGYTIILKDGGTIVAKEKYKVVNGRAIIIQLNGIQTFVRADQIDVAKTDAANREGYGSAVVLPGSPQDVGTPVAQPKKDTTLADLITAKAASPRDLAPKRRDKTEAIPGRLSKTKAGYFDFATLPRKPFARVEVTAELQQFFHGQGIDEVEVFEGTQPDRPFLEITTNSEGSVFKALGAAANALLHNREGSAAKVPALEILLTTPSRERAGQFLLTPEMAADLAAKKVDVTAFFTRNVQF
jgi:hypothetical protein